MEMLGNAGGAVDYGATNPNYREEEDRKINPMNYNETETEFVNIKLTNDQREILGLPLVGRPKNEDEKHKAPPRNKLHETTTARNKLHEPMTTRQTTKLKKAN
jgi:hypothetical protein